MVENRCHFNPVWKISLGGPGKFIAFICDPKALYSFLKVPYLIMSLTFPVGFKIHMKPSLFHVSVT